MQQIILSKNDVQAYEDECRKFLKGLVSYLNRMTERDRFYLNKDHGIVIDDEARIPKLMIELECSKSNHYSTFFSYLDYLQFGMNRKEKNDTGKIAYYHKNILGDWTKQLDEVIKNAIACEKEQKNKTKKLEEEKQQVGAREQEKAQLKRRLEEKEAENECYKDMTRVVAYVNLDLFRKARIETKKGLQQRLNQTHRIQPTSQTNSITSDQQVSGIQAFDNFLDEIDKAADLALLKSINLEAQKKPFDLQSASNFYSDDVQDRSQEMMEEIPRGGGLASTFYNDYTERDSNML